jgi:predicted dehydrogenase
MIHAGIVGLGRWGRSLVSAVAGRSDDIRFVLAATRTRAGAEEFCRDREIALVDGYERMLRDPNIDAVVLATPHSQHRAQALAAIAASKHVFVEKPLTLDLADALAVADAARKSGLVLAVGFTRRFHPSVAELRGRARDGRLGKIAAMVAQHTTSTAQFIAPDNWRAAPGEAPAGAFTAVGVHTLDHMIEFAGRVRDVRCVTARNYPGPSDDTTTIMLRFEAGASGLIFCSVATATNFEFTAYGSNGLAEISRPDLSRFRFAPVATARPGGLVPAPADEILEFPGFDMLHAEMTAFARAVGGGAPYPVPIADVLHGMAVFDAVVASAQRGDIVAVRG